MNDPIIEAGRAWGDGLGAALARYLIDWEAAECDAAVSDVFGYFALQCGSPWLDCLRANRMPTRIRAMLPGDTPVGRAESGIGAVSATALPAGDPLTRSEAGCCAVWLENFEDLPFSSQSLDLVVLAHVLERSPDPHQVLREVDRVLRPEGRLVITGFNPLSLWTARGALPRMFGAPLLPDTLATLAPPRLRDWLKLLGFEAARTRYGCFRPPCRTQRWLDRTAWLETAGDRWWPILGAVYSIVAVKRVHAMRLVEPGWRRAMPAHGRPAVAAPRRSAHAGALSDTGTRATSAAD